MPGLKNPFAIGQLQTFINNQVVLIKSQFVIKAALAPRDIAGLDLVRSQRNKDAWLFKSLDVQNPAGTSLLVLTLESPGDVDELKAVLNSVVTAYENEVVAADMISSAERRRSAEEHFKELKIDFGQLVERQQALAAELKGQDDSTEMRLLKIRIEVLENLLMDAEKAARNQKMYVSIGASPVLVVQKAMVVPTP